MVYMKMRPEIRDKETKTEMSEWPLFSFLRVRVIWEDLGNRASKKKRK